MALHHISMPICWVVLTVMIVGTSMVVLVPVVGSSVPVDYPDHDDHQYPDSVYYGYNMVDSCQTFQRTFQPSLSIAASAGVLVYATSGSLYNTGLCQYVFSTATDGRLFLNAERMGLDETGSCLNFYESSALSMFSNDKIATYCGNSLFKLNTTKLYLKIEMETNYNTERADFRLVVTPFFENDLPVFGTTFTCDDGSKISSGLKSDGHQNCPDNSDEKDASALPCSSHNMLSCGESGPCFAREWKCDRFSDCPNATDEEDCVYKCPGDSQIGESSKLECQDKSGCYYKSDRCRGRSYSKCTDRSENKNCDECNGGYRDYYNDDSRFDSYCSMTRTCLSVEKFCDGIVDCPSGSDEDAFLCNPSIYWYWTGGQLAGLFVGFIIFVIVVIVIVAVVHKKCRKQVG